MNSRLSKAEKEIVHSQKLSRSDPEMIWGWGTPVGVKRSKRRANLIIKGANLGPDLCVLEIGCGTGLFTEYFANSGAKILAIDISEPLLSQARSRGLSNGQVIFAEKNFEDSAFSESFDAIIGSSILHHLDIQIALDKIIALLKPNGIMCFAEPNWINPQIFLERKFRFLPWFDYVSPDESAFVRWKLKEKLIQAGFIDVKITPFDWLHPATPAVLIRSLKTIEGLLENIAVIREFSGSLLIRAKRPEALGKHIDGKSIKTKRL